MSTLARVTEPAGAAAVGAPRPMPRLTDGGYNALHLATEMAHDLRSPLTSIVALADLLRSGQSGPITDTQRRQLGLIYSAALSLCGTTSDALELAHDGDHLLERNATVFETGDVFKAVQDMICPMTEIKGLMLQFELPELGPRLGHAKALSRVLLNLATNAVKFTEAGFVRIAARDLGNKVEFSVRDTGPGLDLDNLDQLYQPFKTARASGRHHFSSSGLGLAICRRLIAAMGSELQIETQPDWGTLFYFTIELPRAR